MSLLGGLVRASGAHTPYLFREGSDFLGRQSLGPGFKSWPCLSRLFGLGQFLHFLELRLLHLEIQIIYVIQSGPKYL